MTWSHPLRLILVILLSFQFSWSAPLCNDVFNGQLLTAEDYATQIGLEKGQDLWGRYLWWKYLRKWKTDKTYTQKSFDKRIDESYEILNKLKKRQNTENKSSATTNSVKWVEKALLKNGLKGYLWGFPKNENLPARIYEQMTRIMQSKPMTILRYIALMRLPNKADKPIPDELLAKIILDGVDNHVEEIEAAYQQSGQSRIVFYKKVQKVVGYLTLVLSMMIQFNNFYNAPPASPEQQAAQQAAEQEINSIEQQMNDIKKQLDSERNPH